MKRKVFVVIGIAVVVAVALIAKLGTDKVNVSKHQQNNAPKNGIFNLVVRLYKGEPSIEVFAHDLRFFILNYQPTDEELLKEAFIKANIPYENESYNYLLHWKSLLGHIDKDKFKEASISIMGSGYDDKITYYNSEGKEVTKKQWDEERQKIMREVDAKIGYKKFNDEYYSIPFDKVSESMSQKEKDITKEYWRLIEERVKEPVHKTTLSGYMIDYRYNNKKSNRRFFVKITEGVCIFDPENPVQEFDDENLSK